MLVDTESPDRIEAVEGTAGYTKRNKRRAGSSATQFLELVKNIGGTPSLVTNESHGVADCRRNERGSERAGPGVDGDGGGARDVEVVEFNSTAWTHAISSRNDGGRVSRHGH